MRIQISLWIVFWNIWKTLNTFCESVWTTIWALLLGVSVMVSSSGHITFRTLHQTQRPDPACHLTEYLMAFKCRASCYYLSSRGQSLQVMRLIPWPILLYWHHPSNSNTLRIISTVSHQDEQAWTLVSSMRKSQCQRHYPLCHRCFHKKNGTKNFKFQPCNYFT